MVSFLLSESAFPWEDTTQSGAYRESAIEPLVSIYSQLLVFVHRDKEMTSEIHIKMANLLYDPDNLDAFDQHYSMVKEPLDMSRPVEDHPLKS